MFEKKNHFDDSVENIAAWESEWLRGTREEATVVLWEELKVKERAWRAVAGFKKKKKYSGGKTDKIWDGPNMEV